MPGHEPAAVALAGADRRVHARGPDRAPQRRARCRGPSGGVPAGQSGAARVTAQAIPGHGSIGLHRRVRAERDHGPGRVERAERVAARLGPRRPTAGAPSRRRSARGPAASTRRCRARRTAGRRRRDELGVLHARHQRRRARRSARGHRARPGRPRRRSRGSASRSPATRRAPPAPGARSGGTSQTPYPSFGGGGSPGTGSSGSSRRAVREPSEPSANVLSQPRRSRSSGSGPSGAPLRSPAASAASSCSGRMHAWSRSPSAPGRGEPPVRLDRPLEVVPRAQRRPGRGRRRRPARPARARAAAAPSASASVEGGGIRRVTSRAAVSCRTPVGRRRRRGGSRRRRGPRVAASTPASASARRLASSAWWSWAQSATRRPGAAASRSAAVGHRPSRSASQPAALDPGRRVRVSRRGRPHGGHQLVDRRARPRASTRRRSSAASARWRWASVRPGTATSSGPRTRRRVPRPRDRLDLAERPRGDDAPVADRDRLDPARPRGPRERRDPAHDDELGPARGYSCSSGVGWKGAPGRCSRRRSVGRLAVAVARRRCDRRGCGRRAALSAERAARRPPASTSEAVATATGSRPTGVTCPEAWLAASSGFSGPAHDDRQDARPR